MTGGGSEQQRLRGHAASGNAEQVEGPFETPLLNRVLAMLQERLGPDYGFERATGPLPWTPAPKLDETCVALVTTGGLHRRGDTAFDVLTHANGDPSYRVLDLPLRAEDLALDAPYVDAKYTPTDFEVALPVTALEELSAAGVVGRAAPRHYSFCGGLTRPWPGLAESAEALLGELREDGVGAVVLLPTCSICVQTVGLLARALEQGGLATVVASVLPELSEFVGTPRTLAVHFPFGAPAGAPQDRVLQRDLLASALELMSECAPGGVRHSSLAWRTRES